MAKAKNVKDMEFSLLLPHFGEHASRERLIDGSIKAEQLGFDAVCVRDHLLFEPHGEMEKPNREFYDALITLTAIGAVTEKIKLTTGSLIPFRHPLHLGLMLGTMTQLVGDRLIVGMGAGTFDHEFEAIGMGHANRPKLTKSNAEILKLIATGTDVSYKDEYYEFEGVTIEPRPVGGPVPYWYCGGTPASVRLAVEYCDGWWPGRINRPTMVARLDYMEEQMEIQGRTEPVTIAVIPPTSVGKTREDALKHVNIEGLCKWANKAKFWVKPESGSFETAEDLEGSLIAGTVDDVVEECEKFAAIGTDHLVFDLRFRFDDYYEQMELLGEVIAKIRAS